MSLGAIHDRVSRILRMFIIVLVVLYVVYTWKTVRSIARSFPLTSEKPRPYLMYENISDLTRRSTQRIVIQKTTPISFNINDLKLTFYL